MSSDERILVFNRKILDDLGTFQGLNFDYDPYIKEIFNKKNVFTEIRHKAEKDYTKKQIIPYVIIEHDNRILYYIRGKESSEKRLVSNASIGIGGHIKGEDDSIFHDVSNLIESIYNNAKKREVEEEIIIESDYDEKLVAVLNDDSNDVGRVHFGIVHFWSLDKPNVKKRERKITQLEFLTPKEILSKKIQLENWSKICIGHIDKILKIGRR